MKKRPYIQNLQKALQTRTFRKHLIVAVLGSLCIWVVFFDSHSLSKRLTWHTQAQQIKAENIELQRMIDELDHQLTVDVSDETIEQLAREHYGMRREGETVYPVKVIK